MNIEYSQQYLFSISPLLTVFSVMHDWLCRSPSFLTVIDLRILSLRQEESVDLFYISSSAREMTSVESQHERE